MTWLTRPTRLLVCAVAFGSTEALETQLKERGVGHFSNGWVWLADRGGTLVIRGEKPSEATVLISTTTAEDAAGDLGVVRPVYQPGDVMLFENVGGRARFQWRRAEGNAITLDLGLADIDGFKALNDTL